MNARNPALRRKRSQAPLAAALSAHRLLRASGGADQPRYDRRGLRDPEVRFRRPRCVKIIDAKHAHRLAALLNLFDIKDCLGEPAEHIGWAWNDPRLGLEERLQVRALGVDRLKRTRAKSVHAFVDYFNFRSSNSIVRIGFKPACVHVTRASANSNPS